ncbi:zinc finger protein 277-like [Lytechinus variegatus]|uniref:zinc finger protein 277-like n=1 Tax=Lytechinus variegatus TaxID=7654 RepID=UPI001BB167F7|nr:zinc finger protein 277-like [Lytechinus variegatus]XP_041458692.1 zinc finger protein 277-like [Lytechinus variegatus]XP_041458693.1 zinc finger protein 277-like [Lytechinus variegatus]
MACAPDSYKDNVIETLQFPDVDKRIPPFFNAGDWSISPTDFSFEGPITCLLCQKEYELSSNLDVFHLHLLEVHQFLIRDSHLICDLKRYIEYWRERFSREDYRHICTVHQESENDVQYRLDSSVDEDCQIREYLQRKRLDAVLAFQQAERDDTSLSRSCLFCRESFTGNRADLFNHMAFSHSFNIGQPDNIVFANDFLDLLERTLQNLQCLYCEKIFRDKMALKDHMRKKQHRRLNPNNKAYDRFYIINYLEAGKDWQTVQAEKDVLITSTDSGDEESWDDWEDDLHTNLVCLFCKHNASMVDDLFTHMVQSHHFDLQKFKEDNALNFYDQIKLVNFIRRSVHQSVCVCCHQRFKDGECLTDHLSTHSDHMTQSLDRKKWDQSQFLFPTFENDALLCSLEDLTDDEDTSISHHDSTLGVPILAEDQQNLQDSFLIQEKDILRTLIGSR